MAQTNFTVKGPIPPGMAVLYTLVPQSDAFPATAEALDGLLEMANDQPQVPTNAAGGPIGEQPDPLKLQVLVQPPADLTQDSNLTGGDSDGDPTFSSKIDWDGSMNPVTGKAKLFTVTAEFVPVTPAP